MRIGYVEWPTDLGATEEALAPLRRLVEASSPDILVTNELPFGPWIAATSSFSRDSASRSVQVHERGLEILATWQVPAVVTSRPIWRGERLINQAVALDGGAIRPLHVKQYFPSEPGWYEDDWYEADSSGFEVRSVNGLNIGVLLCTESMFNEHARDYGRQGASLIVIPRATGTEVQSWHIASAMAALTSGAYVVSSNRVGKEAGGPEFGGRGFAYAPGGHLIGVTNALAPLAAFELDPEASIRAQQDYPCYVRAS